MKLLKSNYLEFGLCRITTCIMCVYLHIHEDVHLRGFSHTHSFWESGVSADVTWAQFGIRWSRTRRDWQREWKPRAPHPPVPDLEGNCSVDSGWRRSQAAGNLSRVISKSEVKQFWPQMTQFDDRFPCDVSRSYDSAQPYGAPPLYGGEPHR